MLIAALQTVGSHRTQDSTNAADAQGSRQKANVEQNLLLSRFQMVRYVMGVDVEIFEWERHHGKHGCAWDRGGGSRGEDGARAQKHNAWFEKENQLPKKCRKAHR